MKDKDPIAEKAQALNLNLTDVKAGIRRLLPTLKMIAALTPTKTDDAAVLFIESLLAE